ncbi:hypothetical protein N665_0576s0012 [Sinapis alba]|nr:hypothetical protein N665_0576s0012 [Sinapis alba]
MSINLFIWNVKGFNDKDKHPAFKNWLNVNKVSIGAILETHVKESNMSLIMNYVCLCWSSTTNHSEDEDGRIIIFWRHPYQVTILLKFRQSVTCLVQCPGSPAFFVLAVYAANTVEERKLLWDSLKDTKYDLSLHSSPWIIDGDFNEIIHCAEHSSDFFNQITPR